MSQYYTHVSLCILRTLTPSQDLNAQLDQAEADTTAAHEQRRATEEQLVGVQEELAQVILDGSCCLGTYG